MARKAKANTGTFSDELQDEMVRRDNDITARWNEVKAEYMRECKEFRAERKSLEKESKDRGFAIPLLRAAIEVQNLEAKKVAVRDRLSEAYHAEYDRMEARRLGSAPPKSTVAIAREAEQSRDRDAIDDFESGLH